MRHLLTSAIVGLVGLGFTGLPSAALAEEALVTVGKPAGLAFEPASFELAGKRAFQQLLVTAKYASGEVRLPGGCDAVMFVPQLPYLPLGDLRTAVAYPHPPETYDDAAMQSALRDVALPHLMIRLAEAQDNLSAEVPPVLFSRLLTVPPSTTQ